jgi:hypothetical protein
VSVDPTLSEFVDRHHLVELVRLVDVIARSSGSAASETPNLVNAVQPALQHTHDPA